MQRLCMHNVAILFKCSCTLHRLAADCVEDNMGTIPLNLLPSTHSIQCTIQA
ncbi:hypothetical protein KC19_8G078000 [Ceratodon purpureus]|uniref:Uncharacterized protein n=1 Tax=Ceratodon purpureus TaxID=3225 RepID=A0A8T0H0Z8_CERPU|nr:hypothetical protein KC19_8G077700 [Ceratodon purpureus]KAG0564037.1 hypothetical protein KC19_8G078000 [Ceratodon purpureus]